MNSLVGVMFEMTGGRFRYVSGHDPYLRPLQSNAGHALIEVYSEDTKKWSIVDSYLDIFTENVSVADIATSEYKNLPVLNSINDRDGVLTFGELFKFRKYGDALGRRPLTSMAYIANNENDFGLDWELTKFNVKTKPLATNTKLYVRARVIASKCPIRYVENLNTADGCFGGIVSYSDWKVKTLELDLKN